MSLSAGTRLGPYRILASLGAGGMGEVYRATDSRLKRQVAVKLLPAALAADPERLERFQREAEVLASLNHPHVAAVYGLEDQDGVKALVMELVEGPTLADRIAQGPLPVDEVLPIARQIADALEAAHERGIVHRDLKPANIKVRDDGTVKVLDFGLAKLTDTGAAGRGSNSDVSQSPTLTGAAAMTGLGVILGTAAYMSPEQARGRAVDKRTDVWAFGAVLYEMLTGVRAFDGEDVTEMMASVVKSTPNWTALPPETPPQVVTLIQRCLEKDRNARIGDIAVARFLLTDHATPGSTPAVPPTASAAAPTRSRTMPLVLAAALGGVLAGGALGWLLLGRSAGPPSVTHLSMTVSPADHLVGSIASVRPSRTAMAISPDGRLVVFAGVRTNVLQLYARGLDRTEATPLAGTEGAAEPFFSPDGAWIGFWVENKIKKVALAGGPPSVICELPVAGGFGASWGADGTIFFANRAGIFKVSSAGGAAVAIPTPGAAQDERQLHPHLLPGGKALLYTAKTSDDWDTANVILQPLDAGARRVLIPGGADARHVPTGHLVYMKTGTLMAVPFDERSGQVTGPPVALIENVMQAINAPNGGDETGAGQFAVCGSGTLLYSLGGVGPPRQSTFAWVDRAGAAQPLAAVSPGAYLSPRLAPDGQRIAVTVRRGASRLTDVWVYDVQRGTPTRLTFDGGGGPIWSPDGKRLVLDGLLAVNADASGKPERLVASDQFPNVSSWAAGSNSIAILRRTEAGANAIWVLPMDGDRKPKLFLESRFALRYPELSPDGRWMAYTSHESGTQEVYVQPYPGPGEKIRISTAGGWEPLWTPNGRELLFKGGDSERRQFFSAAVRSVSPFRTDPPRLMFETGAGEYDSTTPVRAWDVSPDGRRFLMVRPIPPGDKLVTEIHVALDWTEELKRRVPAK